MFNGELKTRPCNYLKMVASIPYVQMLTGLMIMGCTVCQVNVLNGPPSIFYEASQQFSA